MLALQHVSWEDLGFFGTIASEMDVRVATVKLYEGEEIPRAGIDARGYFALLALGSPASACRPETNPRHDELIRLFRHLRRIRVPTFNVCYSMQLFCMAHGGVVAPNPRGKEVGFFPIHLTEEGKSDPVLNLVKDFRTLQWHGDCLLKPPLGCVHLAYSKKTRCQICVMDGIHYLVQGDGQAADPVMLREWFDRDRTWATSGTGVDEEAIIEEAAMRRDYYLGVYRRLFGNFVRLALNRRRSATV